MEENKCPHCGAEVVEGARVCLKCGALLSQPSTEPVVVENMSPDAHPATEVVPTPQPAPQAAAKQSETTKRNSSKRAVALLLSALFAAALIGGGAFIILTGSDSDDKPRHGYAPWVDLTEHFNLDKVVETEGHAHFNSYELTQERLPISRDVVVDGEYDAVVLGKGVWVRSYPQLKKRFQRCQVMTGDRLRVMRSAGYQSGGYWSYAKVNSGRRAGKEGYIPNDYIIEQQKYDLLERYVLTGSTNMNERTPSKYLNAIATVLMKLESNTRHPNLDVAQLDVSPFRQHTIVTFGITDKNVAENSSLLAFVQFFNNNNDFVILGIVPGKVVNQVSQNPNGSYDIYYIR